MSDIINFLLLSLRASRFFNIVFMTLTMPIGLYAQCVSEFVKQIPELAAENAPRLIWGKEFSAKVQAINVQSISVSYNGSVVAFTENPVCTVVGETKWMSKRVCHEAGKLHYLNNEGRELWIYPTPKTVREKNIIGLYDVSVSTNGKYIAASVSQKPCRKEVWKVLSPNDIRKAKPSLHRNSSLKCDENCDSTQFSTVSMCGRDVILLNEKGERLWTYPARGYAKVSPGGELVLIIPYIGWLLHNNSSPEKYLGYEFGNSWYLLDRNGKKLLEKKVETDRDAHAVELLGVWGDNNTSANPFSADGRRFIFDNNIYEVAAGGISKINFKYLPKETYLTNISPNGLYALAISSPSSLGKMKLLDADIEEQDDVQGVIEPRTYSYYLVDIDKRKVLWSKPIPALFRGEINRIASQNVEPYNYLAMSCKPELSNNYLLGCNVSRNVYDQTSFTPILMDIHSGTVSKLWSLGASDQEECSITVENDGGYPRFSDNAENVLLKTRNSRNQCGLIYQNITRPSSSRFVSFDLPQQPAFNHIYAISGDGNTAIIVVHYGANEPKKLTNFIIQAYNISRFIKN